MTDQLNLGLRHIEIDITSGYFEPVEKPPRWPHLDDIFVCHSPVPLDPATVVKVDLAGEEFTAAGLMIMNMHLSHLILLQLQKLLLKGLSFGF